METIQYQEQFEDGIPDTIRVTVGSPRWRIWFGHDGDGVVSLHRVIPPMKLSDSISDVTVRDMVDAIDAAAAHLDGRGLTVSGIPSFNVGSVPRE